MPMSALEHDTVSKLCALCKHILADLQPRLQGLNEIYNAAGGVSATLTQADLDAEAALSGIQKQTVDDAAYALTAQVLPAIENGYAALAQVGARFL